MVLQQVQADQARLSPVRRAAGTKDDFDTTFGPMLLDARVDLPVLRRNGTTDELLVGLARLFKCDAPARAKDRRVCPCLGPAAERLGGRGLF